MMDIVMGFKKKMKSVEFQETSDNSKQPKIELLDSKVSHEGLQILARILARFHIDQRRRLGINTEEGNDPHGGENGKKS